MAENDCKTPFPGPALPLFPPNPPPPFPFSPLKPLYDHPLLVERNALKNAVQWGSLAVVTLMGSDSLRACEFKVP